MQVVAGLLAVLLIVLIVSQVYNVQSKTKEVNDKHIITISAEGKVIAKPDLVTVSAGVQTNGDTAVNAQADNTKKMNAVISYIKNKVGIKDEDVSTQNYSIYQNYLNGSSTPSGYVVNQTLVIKLHDLNKASDLLAGLTQNGINQVQSVDYSINDPDNVREQAREMALSNAKDKASKLANAAGVKLGQLVSFSENTNPGGPIIYDAKASGMGGGGASPQLEPGTQEVTADISVTYEIK
jgi:uncharacterized protein YggE